MASLRKLYLLIIIVTALQQGNLESASICPPQESILPCRCLLRGTEIQVWCSHSNLPKVLEGLRTVGQHLKEPIDELILENNHLPSLPGKTFLPLKVMRLMLRFNGLERVSSDWLSGLEKSLMELFIVEPELRSLPEDSLEHMGFLEAVTIQSNLLKRLPKFSGLSRLRYLQIESLSLVEMSPRHYRALPSLEKLHIVGSPRLTRLEGDLLQDIPKLSLVNISFCGISWMHPRAITHLPSLTELWLVGNKLTDAAIVGRSIRDLPALEILHLDYNHIDTLNEAAFVDLPSLKKLYLSNNKITELHHGSFHRVPNLRLLNLNTNMVRKVHPESFLQHSSSGLEELWLIDNDITHIAELRALLDALPRLTFLDMSNNKLESIPFGALRGHPTLERLHLDHNRIQRIDREAFMAMPALRQLHLKNNTLSDVLEGPFWNLPALKGLDLSDNYFRRVEPRLLANLPSLRRIDLSNNELTVIDPESFLGSSALEHINISNNIIQSLHPATFRHLLQLYEVDVTLNRIVEFVPGLPRGIEYLHLAGNQINQLPVLPSPDLDLPALRMLDLTGNGIQKIAPGGLTSLPQLRKLYIGRNSLQELENGSLDGLKRLEILDLHDNTLMVVYPNALSETAELREINLSENRLSIFPSELLQNTKHLKILDLSGNHLKEVSENTFENARDLRILDLSQNSLISLPTSIHGLKNLRLLDLSNNQFNDINQEMLNSLSSLSEFYLTRNVLQELRKDTFINLPQLKVLHLDFNEIGIIEPFAFNMLPLLQKLKLNNNKLKEVPNRAFNNLSSLQVAELQENQLSSIKNHAFFAVPHLLMLNLSSNQIPGLEEAGLRSLKSLEMLDLNINQISHVTTNNLEKMEWLVELRMDNNQICSVNGSPFNGMPRLRVLTMKNNKMMSFPEHSIQKLRGNLAVLDLDGNPLACSCSILWFRAWLQESALEGPKCNDGTLLREMRLSRQDCIQESRLPELSAPGCEPEGLSASIPHGTSQVFAPRPDLKHNTSGASNNHLAPTPEESEYFYDEYVDYPYMNESLVASNMLSNNTVQDMQEPPISSHLIPGDTPTIYASTIKNISKTNNNSNIPKTVSSSPSSSGFTFFGVPLPTFNLNLNSLLGRGNGRMTEGNKLVEQQIAERKSAIVNNPVHVIPKNMYRFPPTMPEVETGGFVPLLPGSGGFQPIPDPHLTTETYTTASLGIITNTESYYSTSSGHPIPAPTIPPAATLAFSEEIQTDTSTPSNLKNPDTLLTESVLIEKADVQEIEPSKTEVEPTTVSTNNYYSTILPTDGPIELEQAANSDSFENIFKEFVENVSIPTSISSTVVPVENNKPLLVPHNDNSASILLPTLLAPYNKPQGRPIITRVQSPHVSGSAPLLAPEVDTSTDVPLHLPQNLEKVLHYDVLTTQKINTKNQDMTWYYTNYNKTKLEPYVGTGTNVFEKSGGFKLEVSFLVILCVLHPYLTDIILSRLIVQIL